MKSILAVIGLLLSSSSWAHPVSFKGSLGIMGSQSELLSHNQINYSATHRFAFGAHYLRRPNRETDREAGFFTTNFLLKRWNGSSYQGNIYALQGLGGSDYSGRGRLSGVSGLQFDIEDRELYFLAKHLESYNGEGSDFRQSIVRAGVAPYVADFEGIHSWLILQWQQNQFVDEDPVRDVTPFIRVFYNNLLFELGQSLDGVTRFNYITHF